MTGNHSRMFTDDQLDKIARAYRVEKLSTAKLAEQFKCSTAAIRNALKIRGVAMRPASVRGVGRGTWVNGWGRS